MELKHVIDFNDISESDWNILYDLSSDIKKSPDKYSSVCRGKILATLFYEPSTRTQLSFQTAMIRLGGNVIGFADPKNSSVSKGESLRDTIKIISGYSNIIVMRNPIEGAAYAASIHSSIPVINAGDGSHLHPTQTMTDMFTIKNELGRYDGLKIGFCGDLANGRTVHSLIKAFTRYRNITFYLISTKTLSLPEYVLDYIKISGNKFCCVNTIEECIGELDILYMTRIQRERFASTEEYESQSGIYILTKSRMNMANKNLIVMHPLPKVDEIAPDVDDDERAKYFVQAENGLYVRMALILSLCEANQKKFELIKYETQKEEYCPNPRCVTHYEKYLPEMTVLSNGHICCGYCETKLII